MYLLNNTKYLINDIRLALEHIKYLPKIFTNNESDFLNKWPFDEIYDKKDLLKQFSEIMKVMTLGDTFLARNILKDIFYIDYIKEPTDKNEKWIFINGIMTSKYGAFMNGKILNRVIRRPIYVFHNPSHGIIRDIAECIIERSFNRYSSITLSIYSHIKKMILEGNEVKIIAHSQGGIIASNLALLIKESRLNLFKDQIEFYTIAGAQDSFCNIENVYVEHFANECDFVSRIGCISYKDAIQGNLYIREKAYGHLIDKHYIQAITRGDYCNQTSRLYNQIKLRNKYKLYV